MILKIRKMAFMLLFFLIIVNSTVIRIASTNSTTSDVFVPLVPFHCGNPGDESNVTAVFAVETLGNGQYQFNTTKLHANKDSCIKIIYKNLDVDYEHSFIIDETGGGNRSVLDADLSGPNIDAVEMLVENSTTNIGFGPGINVFYVQTPKVDSEFPFFCDTVGHRYVGEEGKLVVGAGLPTTTNSSTDSLSSTTKASNSTISTPNTSSTTSTVSTPGFAISTLILNVVILGIVLIRKRKY